MIVRFWRGWASHQNADAYEVLLKTETIPNILAKNIAGVRKIETFRLGRLGETEFLSIIWFDDMAAVRALAVARGLTEDEFEKSVVSAKARALLRRFDAKVEHYETIEVAHT